MSDRLWTWTAVGLMLVGGPLLVALTLADDSDDLSDHALNVGIAGTLIWLAVLDVVTILVLT